MADDDKDTKKAPPKTSKKSVVKKKGASKKASTKPEFGAKSEFIRSMPREMPAKDVVEAAQKKGLTLTDNLVYAVRASSKNASTKAGISSKKETSPKTKAGKGSRTAPASSLESDLRRCIAELGLARARAIFADVEKAFSGA